MPIKGSYPNKIKSTPSQTQSQISNDNIKHKNVVPDTTLMAIISLILIDYPSSFSSASIPEKLPSQFFSSKTYDMPLRNFLDELASPSIPHCGIPSPSSDQPQSQSQPPTRLNRPFFHSLNTSYPILPHSLAISLYKINIEMALLRLQIFKHRSELRRQVYFSQMEHVSRAMSTLQYHLQQLLLIMCDIIDISKLPTTSSTSSFKLPPLMTNNSKTTSQSQLFTGTTLPPSIITKIHEYFAQPSTHIVTLYYHVYFTIVSIIRVIRIISATMPSLTAYISKTYLLPFCLPAAATLARLLTLNQHVLAYIFPFMTLIALPQSPLMMFSSEITAILSQFQSSSTTQPNALPSSLLHSNLNNLDTTTTASSSSSIPTSITVTSSQISLLTSFIAHRSHERDPSTISIPYNRSHVIPTIAFWYQLIKYNWISWIVQFTLFSKPTEIGPFHIVSSSNNNRHPFHHENNSKISNNNHNNQHSVFPPQIARNIAHQVSHPSTTSSSSTTMDDSSPSFYFKSHAKRRFETASTAALLAGSSSSPSSSLSSPFVRTLQQLIVKYPSTLHSNPLTKLARTKPHLLGSALLTTAATSARNAGQCHISTPSTYVLTWMHTILHAWDVSEANSTSLRQLSPNMIDHVLRFILSYAAQQSSSSMYSTLLQHTDDDYISLMTSSTTTTTFPFSVYWFRFAFSLLSRHNSINSNVVFGLSSIIQQMRQITTHQLANNESKIDWDLLQQLGITSVQIPQQQQQQSQFQSVDPQMIALHQHAEQLGLSNEDDTTGSIAALSLLNVLDPHCNNSSQCSSVSSQTTKSSSSSSSSSSLPSVVKTVVQSAPQFTLCAIASTDDDAPASTSAVTVISTVAVSSSDDEKIIPQIQNKTEVDKTEALQPQKQKNKVLHQQIPSSLASTTELPLKRKFVSPKQPTANLLKKLKKK